MIKQVQNKLFWFHAGYTDFYEAFHTWLKLLKGSNSLYRKYFFDFLVFRSDLMENTNDSSR
jgi:hypothetical protein